MEMFVSVVVTVGVLVSGLVALAFLLLPWLKYDLDYVKRLLKVLVYMKIYEARKMTFIDVFERTAASRPSKVFLRYNDESYTYGDVQRRMSKMANLALTLGLKRGDTVAMFMYNEPAYIWTWMGLATMGVTVAFLNYNLRSKSLHHCFSISDAKLLIVGQDDDLIAAAQEVSNDIKGVRILSWASGKKQLPAGIESLADLYDSAKEDKFDRTALRKTTNIHVDPINYIYTSGTTGLPKAAVLTHLKYLKASMMLTAMTDVSGDDVLYTALPLYHSAAGCIALGNAVVYGMTLVLKRKFSATTFWDDCRKYDVTIIQYIGELCRYLIARPPSDQDRNHKVRIALGNGLRMDIWAKFQQRFGIHRIGEIYAATEGNGALLNVHNRVGVVGRASPILNLLFPVHLIKFDIQSEQPVRDSRGFCIPCKPGEPGLLIIKVFHGFAFDGYKGNKELSQKKLLCDVFKKGDMFFNSGDLLVRDQDYFVYFNDRIGDTFRWKGENVSTQEVANVVSSISWIEDCSVYGVSIPGMAALTLKGEFGPLTDKQQVECFTIVADHLPLYAVPRFLRVLKDMVMTENLKQRKVELLSEGFDPLKTGQDPVYCLNLDSKRYEPLTNKLYNDVLNGTVKF